MNRIFKVIYSKTKHTYVVVSELAKSHVRSKNGGGNIRQAPARRPPGGPAAYWSRQCFLRTGNNNWRTG
ncbi:ESPR domain-containing protein [uncultured Dialister sp.]|uniref:ESPR domain-containing protein n=1 Tax=uncultured Dialister sp. TaxID=278064 RepID=UPI00259A7D8D|nr:ESPR domain-containing protein [uncultured Dialister sp.]